MVDVITVPDFAGSASAEFEARTKCFLASWVQNVRSVHELHLCCIGAPPDSLAPLIDRARATVSIHEPVNEGRFENKFRAFEVRGTADWLLLIDTDALFMTDLDLEPLTDGPPAVYAAPADRPHFDPARWPGIYRDLGLSTPSPSMTLLKGRMVRELRSTYPYHNAGVLLVHRSLIAALAVTWADHLRRIDRYTRDREGFPARLGDQESFATALHATEAPFRTLPDRYNTGWRHLYLGLEPDATSIYHATGFLRGYRDGPIEPHVRRYRRTLRNKILYAAWESPATAYRLPGALRRVRDQAARIETVIGVDGASPAD